MKKLLWLLLLVPSLVFADSEVTVGGKTGAAHIIQDEGTSLRPRPYLNMTGSGVSCSDSGGKTVCNITGGGGGGGGSAIAVKVNGSSVTASVDTLNFSTDFSATDSPSGTSNVSSATWGRTGTNVLLKTSSDNVGIGSATPGTKLDVFGSQRILNSGNLYVSGNVGIGSLAPGSALDVNGLISAGAGTLALPSLSFLSDRTTGFWSPSAGAIDTSIGGTSVVRVTAQANVGIGTVTPSNKLEVRDSSGANTVARLTVNSAGGGSVVGMRLSLLGGNVNRRDWGIFANYSTAGDLAFRQSTANMGDPETAGTTYLTIGSTGNLGVGTTTVPNKLYVAGTAEMQGFKMNATPTNGYVLTSDGNGVGTWQAAGGGAGTNYWNLSPGNVGINTALNVGIGTVSPVQLLQVGQTGTPIIQLGNGASAQNGQIIYSDSGDNSLTLKTNYASGSNNAIYFAPAQNTQMSILQGGRVGIGTTMQGAGTGLSVMSGNVGVGTWNPVAALQIVGTGNVGIGTLSPGATLDIQGNIRTIGASANTTLNVTGGNVGIGSANPGQVLDVQGAIRSSAGTAGQAVCWKADKTLGQCTSVVGAGGACTCS